MTNVLQTTKKLLGIATEHTSFDEDILVYINSSIGTIKQISTMLDENLSTITADSTFEDMGLSDTTIGELQSYIYLKVKMLLDPPASSTISAIIEKQISEMEWRLYMCVPVK